MDIDAKSPQGNAWAIMGAVRGLLKAVDRGDEVHDIMERMRAGSYNNLCDIAEEVSCGLIKVVNRKGEDDG